MNSSGTAATSFTSGGCSGVSRKSRRARCVYAAGRCADSSKVDDFPRMLVTASAR